MSDHLNQDEVDQMTNEVMRFMLFRSYGDPYVPVRREELVDIVSRVYKNRRGFPGAIIENCTVKFSQLFGLELREIQKVRQTKGSKNQDNEGSMSKSYVLRSKIPLEIRKKFIETPQTLAEKGLLSVVLSIVKLEGGRVEQKEFWTKLSQLGMNELDTQHPTFGNVAEAIANLVKQKYLQTVNESSPDGTLVPHYELAENALDEFGEEKIAAFVSKAVDTEEL